MPARTTKPLNPRGLDLPCRCMGGLLEQNIYGGFQHQDPDAGAHCRAAEVDTDYLLELLREYVDDGDTERETDLRALLADLHVEVTL